MEYCQKMITIYKYNIKLKDMSKKPGKGKNSSGYENIDEMDEFDARGQEGNVPEAVELGYITGVILDYYSETGEQQPDEGEEWKVGTEHASKPGITIPEELDKEILKAFMTQIKKFQ